MTAFIAAWVAACDASAMIFWRSTKEMHFSQLHLDGTDCIWLPIQRSYTMSDGWQMGDLKEYT